MEKKFDLKTIIIAALLFFGFVFLIFYKYSNAAVYPLSSSAVIGGTVYDTDSEGNILLQGIFGDETKYNAFRSGVEYQYGITIPEYSSASDFMDNICDYFLGTVFRGTDTAIDTVLQGIDYAEDIFSFITFDPDLGDFVVSPNNQAGLLSEINHHIFVSGSSIHDKWYSLNDTISFYYTYYGGGISYSPPTYATEDFWICWVSNGSRDGTVLISSKQVGPWYASSSWGASYAPNSAPTTYTVNGQTYYYAYRSISYAGNYSDGTRLKYPSSSSPSISYYSSVSVALAALWGEGEPSVDPSLINGISVFENPSFTPLSLPASVVYNFEEIFSDPDPLDPSIPSYRPYSLTYDVPYWLTVPSSEPLSFELPSDYDFNNIDFDYEADPSFLSGAGIIQDVFNILPSKLQGLIFLFGAGSLAFIFLRR